jgi:hypothetical protein
LPQRRGFAGYYSAGLTEKLPVAMTQNARFHRVRRGRE